MAQPIKARTTRKHETAAKATPKGKRVAIEANAESAFAISLVDEPAQLPVVGHCPTTASDEGEHEPQALPAAPSVEQIPIASLERDPELVCRAHGVNKRTACEYAEAMKAGAEFPAIVVFRDRHGKIWLGDGHHRVAAAELEGRTEINANVREGGRREALLFAARANSEHGLRRTHGDRRRAIALVLASHPRWSDRKIAAACNVDHKTVAVVRGATGDFPSSETEREGADGKVRRTPKATGEIPGSSVASEVAAFDPVSEIAGLASTLDALIARWPADVDGAPLRTMLHDRATRLAGTPTAEMGGEPVPRPTTRTKGKQTRSASGEGAAA